MSHFTKKDMNKQYFPFTAIVGQDSMKQALILNAVNPKVGGVLVFGEKGTAKSTAVRALTRLLQGQPLTAAGMVALYLAAMITRTVLEPKFFGKHLGLDPLVMLLFLYVGYRLWGFWGIVISPLLAATTKALTNPIDN